MPVACDVLLVDDNRDACDSLGSILELRDLVVKVVYSGRSAIDLLRHFTPTVAVLDIGMPGMDGYALAGHLRGALPQATLIAHTGWGALPDRERARHAGFHLHFTKPVEPELFCELIVDLCRGRAGSARVERHRLVPV